MKLRNCISKIVLIMVMISCKNSTGNIEKEQGLSTLWIHEYEIIDAPSAVPKVVKDRFLIYTGAIGLKMLDISTGRLLWENEAPKERASNTVSILSDENRILSAEWREFKAWDVNTGEKIFSIGAEDDIVLFDRGRNKVTDYGYALVGDTLDVYVLNKDGGIEFTIDIPFVTNGVGYEGNRLYLGQFKTITGALTRGKIVCYNAQTGDSLWSFETDQGGFTWVAPILENGMLYASTNGNSPGEIAIALNAETGEEIWRQTQEVYTFNSALGPDYYYVNTSGSLAALDKETGNIDWRVEWEGSDFNKPIYLEGFVYHVRDKEMLVINDNTGKVVHKESVPDGTYFWHVAASTDKIFAQTSRQLIAYQPWHLRED
ncbi:PQQ-binding-like beta-propeller repeat protein [Gracilimonas sediminicola]|uniref:PQQ-binding-like beta-propeller repeat protein n=1 Tax=Gracilimonas sediminicola TaxID=2952158 RepID=A0A9X2L4J9_9BACT|nr:PQQ-binding-like beta-propeller repeat protein [Gracilimonas sediminicola]MCP9292253.1 PQQ-binding-like beta-propeller repeat protein [Gracilimonas sediminicola]